MLYAIYVRSFDNKKDQIVEELNEVAILVAMTVLANNSSEGKWTDTGTFVFIGVILMHSWILFIVSVTTAVVNLNRYLKKREGKSQDPNFDEDLAQGVPNLEINEVDDPLSTNDRFGREGVILSGNLNPLAPNTQTCQDLLAEEGKRSNNLQNKSIL